LLHVRLTSRDESAEARASSLEAVADSADREQVLWVRRIRTVRPGDEVVIFGEVLGEIRP